MILRAVGPFPTRERHILDRGDLPFGACVSLHIQGSRFVRKAAKGVRKLADLSRCKHRLKKKCALLYTPHQTVILDGFSASLHLFAGCKTCPFLRRPTMRQQEELALRAFAAVERSVGGLCREANRTLRLAGCTN